MQDRLYFDAILIFLFSIVAHRLRSICFVLFSINVSDFYKQTFYILIVLNDVCV